jgi:MFS family permease
VTFVLTAGVLIGIGQSGVTYSVVSACLGRRYPPEKRSMALGHLGAAGSFGQFAMLPLTQWMLTNLGWHGTLFAPRGRRARDRSAVRGDGRTARRPRTRIPAIGARSGSRSILASRLRAPVLRLLRLRLPGRVRRRAPASRISPTAAWRRTSR